MPQMFRDSEKKIIKSQEILALVNKANIMTDADGYNIYDDNVNSLERILNKILTIAKREEEWGCYFITLYEMLYLLDRNAEHKKLIKYAEVFFQDTEKYLDSAIAQTTEINLGNYCVWSYKIIFSVYMDYFQISEKKLYEFNERFKQAALKYGKEISYYEWQLNMALKYRDKESAAKAKNEWEKYEIQSCYLCAVKPLLGYYVLFEDYESLEYKIEEIRTRTIPAKHRWCYTHCYLAEDKELISEVLLYCVEEGKSDYFHKFFEKNKELYKYEQNDWDTNVALYHAYAGDWVCMDEHIKRAEDDVNDWRKMKESAWDYIRDSLSWYCYFTLLDRHGIPSVKTELAGSEVPAIKNGECSCLNLAEFFEAEADKTGTELEKVRGKFDYRALKHTYELCFDIK